MVLTFKVSVQAYLQNKTLKCDSEEARAMAAAMPTRQAAILRELQSLRHEHKPAAKKHTKMENEGKDVFRFLYVFKFQSSHPELAESGQFEFGDFKLPQHKTHFSYLMKRLFVGGDN